MKPRILYFKSGHRYSDYPILISKPAIILLEVKPIIGLYTPDVMKPIPRILGKTIFRNKGYRNIAFIFETYLTNTSQTVINTGGASHTMTGIFGISGSSVTACLELPVALNFGSATTPHDVSRYELYSRHFTSGPMGFWWKEEYADRTELKSYHEYMYTGTGITIGEVAFYWRLFYTTYDFLLCRSIIDPTITKDPLTKYTDGYELEFPANFTRWLLRALYNNSVAQAGPFGDTVRATDGLDYVVRGYNNPVGLPDVRIGSSNVAPSVTHYSLQSEIGALGSQTEAVEIDTTLQECRILRSGTRTPPANETLGEVGRFMNIYDTGGTSRKIMVARGIWDPTVTLIGGTTYTIGIVLKFG